MGLLVGLSHGIHSGLDAPHPLWEKVFQAARGAASSENQVYSAGGAVSADPAGDHPRCAERSEPLCGEAGGILQGVSSFDSGVPAFLQVSVPLWRGLGRLQQGVRGTVGGYRLLQQVRSVPKEVPHGSYALCRTQPYGVHPLWGVHEVLPPGRDPTPYPRRERTQMKSPKDGVNAGSLHLFHKIR